MANQIQEDYQDYRDITEGNRREELKKFTKNGKIWSLRPDGKGKISIPTKEIDLPIIVHGESDSGVGAGPGKPGDVIGKKPEKGKGDKGKPGKDPGEGNLSDIDMEEVWKELQAELSLPNIKPKDTPTFEDIRIKYNGVSKIGPRSLLHLRRTMRETMKRELAYNGGKLPLEYVPGTKRPIHVLRPIKDDFRYRQFNEYKQPTSNAVIGFLRDGSGSMDEEKCNIVNDMAFWIEMWIKRFYRKTEKFYVWHDTEARELSQKDFYRLREGGGTRATSSLEYFEKQLKFRFNPSKWNLYLFYFGDGETFGEDNVSFIKMLKNQLGPKYINLVGVTQVLGYRYQDSLKQVIDKAISKGELDPNYVRTTNVGGDDGKGTNENRFGIMPYQRGGLDPEARGLAIKNAMIDLLGVREKVTA